MSAKLVPGETRVGHTRSEEGAADEIVVATFDDRGVKLEWPRALGFAEALDLNDDSRVPPDPLIMRDGGGWLTLMGAWPSGVSASSLGHSVETIRYRAAIASGSHGVDFSEVNGMTSEIDGLADWAKLVPVETTILVEDETRHSPRVRLDVGNVESVRLGGPLDLALDTSFHHMPGGTDGVFTISTALLVRTRSAETQDWTVHQQTHRMVQDLASLVYGRPCESRLVSVMREDDQDSVPTDERRFWRDAYQPSFGRQSDSQMAPRKRNTPLFYLDEVDRDAMAAWLNAYDYWSRPTWIAMSAIYEHGLPVESRLLHVAVALEALGYAILHCKTPDLDTASTFSSLVRAIFDDIGRAPAAVVKKHGSAEAWTAAFNRAYKGIKHADNPLTPALEAWERGLEGIALIRCWIAAELGVSAELVDERLARE